MVITDAGFYGFLGKSFLLQKLIHATVHIFFSVSLSGKLVRLYVFQSSVCGWPEQICNAVELHTLNCFLAFCDQQLRRE